jgi:hypothetical protein
MTGTTFYGLHLEISGISKGGISSFATKMGTKQKAHDNCMLTFMHYSHKINRFAEC